MVTRTLTYKVNDRPCLFVLKDNNVKKEIIFRSGHIVLDGRHIPFDQSTPAEMNVSVEFRMYVISIVLLDCSLEATTFCFLVFCRYKLVKRNTQTRI